MRTALSSNSTVFPNAALLSRELDEIDRLVHSVRTRLVASATRQTQLSHWREMRGVLKGKITEDPLAYQRRIRTESECQPV